MTTNTQPKSRCGLDIDAILYWELPQLDAAELAGLIATVHSELEARVGVRLASLCTDDELVEFERLVETEDDEMCANWLAEHIPHHREIVRSVADVLLAETLAAIEGKQNQDPAVSRLRRPRVEPADKKLLLRTLRFRQRRYAMDGDVAVVKLVCRTGISTEVRLRMTESGLLCVRSHLPFPDPEHRPGLLAFVRTWNQETYVPKAYTADASDGTCDVVAELAVPLAPGVHGQLLDYILSVCLGAITRMFDELLDRAAEWQPPL